jgi:hypothetical protein
MAKKAKPAEPSPESPILNPPAAAAAAKRPVVMHVPPACPSCHSTRRKSYRDGRLLDRWIYAHEAGPAEMADAPEVASERIGVEIRGQFYNREVWRNTQCADCGQHYRVVEYRFEPNPKAEQK